jgi:alkylglycerol monooxygenase
MDQSYVHLAIPVARRAKRPLDKVRVLWKRPGWRPDDLGGTVGPSEVDRAALVKYDVPAPRGVALYVLTQFVAVNVGTVAFLYQSERLGLPARAAGALAVVWSLASLGALLDRRPWAVGLEATRLLAASLALLLSPLPGPVAAGGVARAMLSATWILRGRNRALPLTAGLR